MSKKQIDVYRTGIYLRLSQGFDKDAIYQLVEGEVGIDAIIKFKRKNNLDITDKELDYMISKLP